MKRLHLISITAVSALLLTACNFESFEKRCAREAEEYTARHCPKRINKYTVIDSLTFNPETKTFGYYYTLEGDLDNDTIISKDIADSFRDQLKKELTNSVELKAYKERNLNFSYIYISQSTGKVRFETLFTPEDYNVEK